MRVIAELVIVSESTRLESKVMNIMKLIENIEVEITRKGELQSRKKKFIQKDTWFTLKMKCREYEYNDDIMKLIKTFKELIDYIDKDEIKDKYIEIVIYGEKDIGIVNLEFDVEVIRALVMNDLGLPISIYS